MKLKEEKKICDEIIGAINLGYDNIKIPNDGVRNLLKSIFTEYSYNLEEKIAHVDYWKEVCSRQDTVERC